MDTSSQSQAPSQEANPEYLSGLHNSHESGDYWGRNWDPSPATNSPQSVFSTGTGISSDWNRSEQSLFNLDAEPDSSESLNLENSRVSTSFYPSHIAGVSEMDDLPEGLEHTPRTPFHAASLSQGSSGSVQAPGSRRENTGGSRRLECEWKGCTRRASFTSQDDLMRHVRSIHITPTPLFCTDRASTRSFHRKDSRQLECEWKGCRRPSFTREADLMRHIKVKHIMPASYVCPDSGCGKSFNRKDHLQAHLMRQHPNFRGTSSALEMHPNDNLNQESNFVVVSSIWELPLILDGIPEDERLTFILNTITLTMSEAAIHVMPCQDFIQTKYGSAGIELASGLLSAIMSNNGRYKNNVVSIQCSMSKVSMTYNKSNHKLRDLLVWLCLTFRQPNQGSICISTCKVEGQEIALQRLFAAIPDESSCWFRLFKTAVIAVEDHVYISEQGFLYMDFLYLLQLAAVEYPILVDTGLVLMGFSTALIPIRMVDDKTILWHLETGPPDTQLKVDELQATRTDWLKTTDFEDLRTQKALLGWCSEAFAMLGTGQLGVPQWSGAKTKPSTWTWTGANLQAIATSTAPLQLGAQAGIHFERSPTTLQIGPSDNYLSCLRSSAKEQVILYSVDDSRAWLVPLICMLHEMLLANWRAIPDSYKRPGFPLATPSYDGASASLDALWANGGFAVAESPDDRQTIRDLILGFSANLSKVRLHPASGPEIYGYELMDLAEYCFRGELKKSRVSTQGHSWLPLLKGVNCFFYSGLGDVIRGSKASAVDSPCNQLVTGHDWLAASMHSLAQLNRKNGGGTVLAARRLSPEHYWLLTGSPFQKCAHVKESKSSCWTSGGLLQGIGVTGSFPDDCGLNKAGSCENGAVVFGTLNHHKSYTDRMREWGREIKHISFSSEGSARLNSAVNILAVGSREQDTALTAPSLARFS